MDGNIYYDINVKVKIVVLLGHLWQDTSILLEYLYKVFDTIIGDQRRNI